MAEEEQQDESVDLEAGSKKKLIIIIAAGVMALLLVTGAVLYFMGIFDDEKPSKSSDPAKEESAEKEANDESDEDDSVVSTATYLPLSPAFLVNFKTGNIRVLKVEISLLATDDKVIDAVKLHDPVIRNNILLLLSNQDPEALKTLDGKMGLQAAIKGEINKVLADKQVPSNVKDVFFTELVMQ
ncbi:MAG: flagellar basal body-associated FliL family protein [Cycloclasticus sp.]|nr:flagellar basal body-associated FliL family protein [Cycloclasticus sp.]MBQ0789777.1 flagellar basal body-associated FliL family protein [Cycloclasticus sp.]